MSLVNDALRRAKEAQQQTPPSAARMQLQPIEPQKHARQNLGLLLPVSLAVLALLGLLLLWQAVQGRKPAEVPQARALTPDAARAAAAPKPVSPALTTAPAPAPAVEPTRAQKPASGPRASATAQSSLPLSLPTDAAPAALATDLAPAATNAVAVAPLAPPQPPPLRLQAIVYNPPRNSALISGKSLFIGEKLGEMRVVAIDRDSATLVGGGKTNVLSLPE